MFRRRVEPPPDARIVIEVDGRPIEARQGDLVAAALLLAGIASCRTSPVTGEPRGPYCLMGVCFECLCTIDGRPSVQACMVEATAGMQVRTQAGRPVVGP